MWSERVRSGQGSGGTVLPPDIPILPVVHRDHKVHHHRTQKRPRHQRHARQHEKRRREQYRVEAKLHPARLNAAVILKPQCQNADPAKGRAVAEDDQKTRRRRDPAQKGRGGRVDAVEDDRARGFALGLSSHAIGTARAFQLSEIAGAFASLGMMLNALLTIALVPLVIALMGF